MTAETGRVGRASAGDTKLSYTRVGEGPAVLAIHGVGLGSTYLRSGFDRLASGRQIVYYDHRGTGESELGDPDRASFAGTLADLDDLLTELGIEVATLIGHSTGAWVAAIYAATRPEQVRAVVLAHLGPPLATDVRERFSSDMASRRPQQDTEEMARLEASDEYARGDTGTLERHFQLRYAPFFRDRETGLAFRYGFTHVTAANILEAGGRLMSDFGAHDPAGSLGRIGCPTLVVHGSLDPIPVESSVFVAEAIPNARLVVLENVNHFSFAEDTDVFVQAVEPFLREHAS